jgi:uncharacterized protein YbcI
MTYKRSISPIQPANAMGGLSVSDDPAPANQSNGHSRPPRGTTDGPASTAICDAVVGALKRVCGKGPTKVKAYGLDDHVAVVARDMLTTLERALVQSGHEQLVREARAALADQVAKECRAAIEEATGQRVVGWQSQVDPCADSAFALVRLQPPSPGSTLSSEDVSQRDPQVVR